MTSAESAIGQIVRVPLAHPTLSPSMLWRGVYRFPSAFPFDDPRLEYFCLGRNAVYALAQEWKLSGREILFPSYFEGVELEALLQAGVRLRFYRVGPRMRVDLADIEASLTSDTRAIYLIHYLGFPGPVQDLAQLSRERNVMLIEDCALALLSRLGSRPLGTFGDAAIFSFRKSLPVAHGGGLIVRNQTGRVHPRRKPPSFRATGGRTLASLRQNSELAGRKWLASGLSVMRRSGKAAAASLANSTEWHGGDEFRLEHSELGTSRLVRMIIAGQDFPTIVERRRRNYLRLLDRLAPVATPIFPSLPEGACPWVYAFEFENAAGLAAQLQQRGIEAEIWQIPHPAVSAGAFPESERLRRTTLRLPCHQDLDSRDLEWLADQVWRSIRELN